MSENLKKYHELAAKVDSFFEAAFKKHRSSMECRVTCSDCCKGGLTVTRVEAITIKDFIQDMSPLEKVGLSASLVAENENRCSALNAKGQCQIYPVRPIVCRSHGAPIKKREEKVEADGSCTECILLECCHLNFTKSPSLEDLDDSDFIDQETLSTILGTIDIAYSDERGKKRGQRFALKRIIEKNID